MPGVDRAHSRRTHLAGIVEAVRAERPALDHAIHARIRDVAPGPDDDSAQYEAGQFAAIAEALDYTLDGIEHGAHPEQPIPPAALAQARRAAGHDVSLDTILRRYHAAQNTLASTIERHVDRDSVAGDPVAVRLLFDLHELHNLLAAEVAGEYAREVARLERSPAERRAGRVERLLSGASSDRRGLDYDLDSPWHLCIIAAGAGAGDGVSRLAGALNRRVLAVPRSDEIVWAWLGGSRPITVTDVQRVWPEGATTAVNLAVGEPQCGFDGWRVTYKQAQVALRISLLAPRPVTRYADVALVEAIVRDQSLALAYVDTYLSPLDQLRISGPTARQTLEAFFNAGTHVEDAARMLKVNRSTMRDRISKIEEGLGHPISTRQAELEVALRVEALLTTGSQRRPAQRQWRTDRPRSAVRTRTGRVA